MKRAPWPLTDPIPSTCRVEDVCRILQMSRATFDRLMTAGKLPLVEMQRFGGLRRFTGESVAAAKRSRFAPQSLRRVAS